MEPRGMITSKWLKNGIHFYSISRCPRWRIRCRTFWRFLYKLEPCNHKLYVRHRYDDLHKTCMQYNETATYFKPPQFEKAYWGVSEYTFNEDD